MLTQFCMYLNFRSSGTLPFSICCGRVVIVLALVLAEAVCDIGDPAAEIRLCKMVDICAGVTATCGGVCCWRAGVSSRVGVGLHNLHLAFLGTGDLLRLRLLLSLLERRLLERRSLDRRLECERCLLWDIPYKHKFVIMQFLVVETSWIITLISIRYIFWCDQVLSQNLSRPQLQRFKRYIN